MNFLAKTGLMWVKNRECLKLARVTVLNKFDLKILEELYDVTFVCVEEIEILLEVISKLLYFLLMEAVRTRTY